MSESTVAEHGEYPPATNDQACVVLTIVLLVIMIVAIMVFLLESKLNIWT